MFCTHCGSKIDKDSKFCRSCGKKVLDIYTDEQSKVIKSINDIKFYSEDWQRTKVFVIASPPYFDVMVDKDNIYLIKLPRYHSRTLGLFLGLFLFSIIGAIVGSFIGSSNDAKKRKNYRSAWLDSEYKIISRDYDKDIFIKFPLKHLKNNFIIKKNKFILTNGDRKFTFKKRQEECERFNKFIEKYVLQKLWQKNRWF